MIMTDKAWKLCQDCGGLWADHPKHKVKDWRNAITRDSYWNWVVKTIEENEEDEDGKDS